MQLEQSQRNKASLAKQATMMVAGFFLPFLLIQPTLAALSGVAETVSPIIDDVFGINIDRYIRYLEESERLYAVLNNKNLSSVIQSAEWILGEMGYPVAGQTPQSIRDLANQVIQEPNPFNPTVLEVQDSLMGEATYQMQKASVEAELGEQGQQVLKEEQKIMAQLVTQSGLDAQTTAESAGMVQELADEAQSRAISQEVLKLMSQQNGELAQQFAKISTQSSYNAAVLQGIYNEVKNARINGLIQNQGLSNLVRNDQRREWETRITELGQQVYNSRLSAQGFGYGLPVKGNNQSLFP